MDHAMAMEDGYLIIETQKVINMRDSIAMTKRVDSDCTNGRTELFIKGNF